MCVGDPVCLCHQNACPHRYDIASATWAVVPPCGLPARSVFGVGLHLCNATDACSHAGHMLAFGGEVDPSTKGHSGAGDFSDALFCYEAGQVGGWKGWGLVRVCCVVRESSKVL